MAGCLAPAHSAQHWVDLLGLLPHPEGGYYRETTRASYVVTNEVGKHRFAFTSIYFLLTPESPSHLHRLCSAETWFYHAGDPLQVHCIFEGSDDELALERAIEPADRASEDPEGLPTNQSFISAAVRRQREVPTQTPSERCGSAPRAKYERYRCVRVGPNVETGDVLQYTVPARAIFGSSVASVPGGAGYSLVSCVVSPGFDFRDFELFTQANLMQLCPQHEKVIREMAYEEIPPPSA